MKKSSDTRHTGESARKILQRTLAGFLCALMCMALIPITASSALNADETIVAVQSPKIATYSVANGTKLEEIGLPDKLTVTVSTPQENASPHTREEALAVVWEGTYRANTAGTYTLTAAFRDEGYSFKNMPHVTVKVGAKGENTELNASPLPEGSALPTSEESAQPTSEPLVSESPDESSTVVFKLAEAKESTESEEGEEEPVFERIELNLNEKDADNDLKKIPNFYKAEDLNEKELTASLFSFTDAEGSVYYRVYGSFGELEGFFECNASGGNVQTSKPTEEAKDKQLYERKAPAVEASEEEENAVLLLPQEVFAPILRSGGDEGQGLVATVTTRPGTVYTGKPGGYVQLQSSLASTENVEVEVRVPITCSVPGLTLPQFTDNGSGELTYAVGTNNEFVLTLVCDSNGYPSYIKYTIQQGETFSAMLRATVPNGTSPNTSDVVFGDPVPQRDGAGNLPYMGPTVVSGDTLEMVARFGWENVNIRCDREESTIRLNGESTRIFNDFNYTIAAGNTYGGATSGVIFTAGYTLSDTITLPEGVAFPAGEVTLTNGNKTIMIGGVQVATFNKAIESASVSGKTLTFRYAKDNETLTAAGTPEAGKTAKEIESLSLGVTLKATNLVITDPDAANGKMVTHATVFDATPCQGDVTAAHSTASAQTKLTLLGDAIQLTKSNSPGSDTVIASSDTPITYTISAENAGITAKTLTLSDNFDANTVYVAGSGSSNYATPSVTATGITWANVSINPGEVKTFTFQVKVKPGTADGTKIKNSASASYDGSKTATSNEVENTYNTKNRIALTKTTTSTVVRLHDVVPYTITVRNLNTSAATNQPLVIVDTLQAGLILTDAQEQALRTAYPGATYDRGTNIFTIPGISLDAGQTRTFTFNATVDQSFADNSSITNTAQIQGDDTTISEAAVKYQRRRATLDVKKEALDTEQISADTFRVDFRISAKNLGLSTAVTDEEDPLQFVDNMGAGLTPPGAGTATAGTITGVDSTGATVTGNWTRTGSAAPYTYRITWPKNPILETGETYWIEYSGEVKVTLVNGTFDAITVSNDVVIGKYTDGIYPVIYPPMSLDKSITVINEQVFTGGIKESDVYAGDVIKYTITLANSLNEAATGTLTDTLPEIIGTDFAWVYGDNVRVVAGDAPDGPTVQNGQLVWSNVTVPATSTKTYTIELSYPTENMLSTFDEVFTNNATYQPAIGQALTDFVTHTPQELNIEAVKTADKASVDAGTEATEAERTVVFTLSDFGTDHYASRYSLLDNMDEVRKLFDIVSIDFGQFVIANTNTANPNGYTIELTYEDTTVRRYTVAAGATPSITHPSGKSIADVVTAKWEFGDVNSVEIVTAPTVTVRAKTGVAGTVTNRMFLAYNLNYLMKDASVTVRNSDQLSKKLYDANDTFIDPADPDALVTRNTDYYYVIEYTNVTQAPINLNSLRFTDTCNTLALDGDHIYTVEATILPAAGVVAEPVAPQSQQLNLSSGTGELTFTAGQLLPGDTLRLRYDIRTGNTLQAGTTEPLTTAPLLNTIKVSNRDGTDEIEATSGPFVCEAALYVYMQKSVCGMIYLGDDGKYYFYNDMTRANDAAGAQPFDNMNIPMYGVVDGKDIYRHDMFAVYNVTIINSGKSTVTLSSPSNEPKLTDSQRGASIGNTGGTLGSMQLLGSGDVQIDGAYGLSESARDFLTLTGGREIVNKKTGETIEVVSTDLDRFSRSSYGDGGSGGWQSRYYRFSANETGGEILRPGETLTVYIYMSATGPYAETLDNGASFSIVEEGTDGAPGCLTVPVGTAVYWDDSYDLDIPTFSNTATPNVGGAPSVHGTGDIMVSHFTSSGKPLYKLEATTTLMRPTFDISIEKEAVAVVKPEDQTTAPNASSTLEQVQAWKDEWVSLDDTAADLTDWIVWKISVTNPNDFPTGYHVLRENVPSPYYGRHSIMVYDGQIVKHQFIGDGSKSLISSLQHQVWISRGLGIPAGETVEFYVVCAPRTTGGVHVGYETYTNKVELLQGEYDASNIVTQRLDSYKVRTVVNGTPITRYGNICGAYAEAPVTIGGIYGARSYKTVTNTLGDTAAGNSDTRVVTVDAAETFSYTLNVENKSTFSFQDFVVIDRLPAVGDRGVRNIASARNSEFAVAFAEDNTITAEIQELGETTWTTVPSGDIEVGYKTTPTTVAYSETDWSVDATGWDASPDAQYDNSVRIELKENVPAGAKVRITVRAKLKDPAGTSAGQIAWNSFGYCYKVNDQGEKTLYAEPATVGVKIKGAYLAVDKVDTDARPLENAVFTVYATEEDARNNTNPVTTMTTANTGKARTAGLLGLKTWYVKETTSPIGYLSNNTIYMVDLTNATPYTEVNITTENDGKIVNGKSPLTLKLTKAFAAGAEPADGTKVTVKVTGEFYGMDQTMTLTRDFIYHTDAATNECNGVVEKELTNLLKPGSSYTITETVTNGADTLSYSFTATATDSDNDEVQIIGGVFAAMDDTKVQLVNSRPQPGMLRLQKVVAGYDGGETFTIRITGPFNNGDGTTSTFKDIVITPEMRTVNQTSALIEVPGVIVGKSYVITEEFGGTNYETTVTVNTEDKNFFVMPNAPDGIDVIVTNTRKPAGKLNLVKQIDGAAPAADAGPFTVEVTAAAGSFTDDENKTTETVTLDSANNFAATLQNLKSGVTYTVTEVNIPNQYVAKYEGLDDHNRVRVDENDVNVTVNNLTTTELSVQKVVEGVWGNKKTDFEFTVTLTDAEANPQPGNYPYTYTAEEGVDLPSPATGTLTVDANGVSAPFTLRDGQTITIKGIKLHANYVVTETAAGQDGYTTDAIGANGTDLGVPTTAVFINTRDMTIPTGVILEVLPYVVIILIVVGVAVAWIVISRKQKERARKNRNQW